MNNNRPLLIIACVVLAIIGGSLWFLNTKPVTPTSTTPPADVKVPIGPSFGEGRASEKQPDPYVRPEVPKKEPIAKATPRPIQAWERKIDEVLASSADETQTAQILINML
ncbi:MAG TPA: hypothetical protein VFG14_12305, partial [Chthoniobacteraceae bacterium]|nr:hypothetical protein [Chthoniobacteraceae bacterium]